MNDLQELFCTALLDPEQPVPPGLSDGAKRRKDQRFNVYRNNIAVSLREAIRAGFPIITKLLGGKNMDGLAQVFLRAHPPSSPVLMHYGAKFPAFLAGTAQLSHLGYLADVARLELAIRRSYHAADTAAIAPDLLANLAPETLMRATLTFAPTVQLIRSDWPIFDIWRYNTEPDAPKPRPEPQDVLVTRPEFDPAPQLLPPGAAIWILDLMNGQSIGAAHDAALANTPDFDLTAPLTLLLQGGALISLNS